MELISLVRKKNSKEAIELIRGGANLDYEDEVFKIKACTQFVIQQVRFKFHKSPKYHHFFAIYVLIVFDN